MEIKDVKIPQIYMGSLSRLDIDGERHIKTLPFVSVVQATEGEYEIRIGSGNTCRTGTGGIFIAPSGAVQTITHHVDPATGRMSARWVFVDAVVNGAYAFDSVLCLPVLVPEQRIPAYCSVLDDIFRDSHPCERMIGAYRLVKLLMELALPKVSGKGADFTVVEQYISAHYRDKITVRTLAELLHLSESAFYLLFKKHFGVSPMTYVNNYRLSMASLLLHDPDISIREAAERAGFSDPFYFSKIFKKKFSVSPSRYRAQVLTIT